MKQTALLASSALNGGAKSTMGFNHNVYSRSPIRRFLLCSQLLRWIVQSLWMVALSFIFCARFLSFLCGLCSFISVTEKRVCFLGVFSYCTGFFFFTLYICFWSQMGILVSSRRGKAAATESHHPAWFMAGVGGISTVLPGQRVFFCPLPQCL